MAKAKKYAVFATTARGSYTPLTARNARNPRNIARHRRRKNWARRYKNISTIRTKVCPDRYSEFCFEVHLNRYKDHDDTLQLVRRICGEYKIVSKPGAAGNQFSRIYIKSETDLLMLHMGDQSHLVYRVYRLIKSAQISVCDGADLQQ